MCTKNEIDRETRSWAHNLFVMQALDFLPWVILAQRLDPISPTFVFLPSPFDGSIALNSKLLLEPFNNLFSSLASHIYSP